MAAAGPCVICCSVPSKVVTVLRPSKVIGVPCSTRMKAVTSDKGNRMRVMLLVKYIQKFPKPVADRAASALNTAANAAIPVAALTN